MIALLNAYFECLAGAVLEARRRGAEVHRRRPAGGVPIRRCRRRRKCGRTPLWRRPRQACAELDRLNAEPPPRCNTFGGWKPLRTGIALHEGDVFFGNVGAPERLDFTVIGRAVNAASRVEALQQVAGPCDPHHRDGAARLDRPLDDLGRHDLRGVVAPVGISALGSLSE